MAPFFNTYKPIIGNYGESHHKEVNELNNSENHQNTNGDFYQTLEDIQEDCQQRIKEDRSERSGEALEQRFELRPYQRSVIKDVNANVRISCLRQLIYLPTGAGKTIVACELLHLFLAQGNRTAIIVHRNELVGQFCQKLKSLGIHAAVVKAGHTERKNCPIQIISVQTLAHRPKWLDGWDVLVFDEAHITCYAKVSKKLFEKNPNALVLGLSATPWRLKKQERLGDIFQTVVAPITGKELIEAGYLVRPVVFGIKVGDFQGIKIRGGDFETAGLSRIMSHPQVIQTTFDAWKCYAGSQRRAIVFCVDIAHAMAQQEKFLLNGVSAAIVTGETPLTERAEIYTALDRGEIQVLISVAVLTEGFDLPSVDCVMLCRPTKSKALGFQMLGRGLRLSPETEKTDCLVLDFANFTQTFGFFEDLGVPNIFEDRSKKDGQAPVKICPDCQKLHHASVKVCDNCEHIFPLKEVEHVPTLEIERKQRQISPEESFLKDLISQCWNRGYNPGWILHKYRDRYGEWPPFLWFRNQFLGSNPGDDLKRAFITYIVKKVDTQQKREQWFSREFGPQWRQVLQSLGEEVAS